MAGNLNIRKKTRIDPRLPWLADVRRMLSPMAGVTDRPFREICRRFGADMGFCEFASASGLTHGGEATWRLVDTQGEKGRVGIQIFGSDPQDMASAARLLSERHMDVLDINFGCPAKKVVKKTPKRTVKKTPKTKARPAKKRAASPAKKKAARTSALYRRTKKKWL